MEIKKLILIITTVMFLISTVMMSGCTDEKADNSKDTGDNINGGSGGTTSSGFISAKYAWEKVESTVEAWDLDFSVARIENFGMGQWAQDGKELDWDFYVESGDGSKSTTFTYSVETDKISKTTDTPFDTGGNTFKSINWTIDSTEAVEIALNAVRADEFPDFDGGFESIMYADENGNPYWEVGYSSIKKDGHTVDVPLQYGEVEINAQTGEIISITASTD